MKKLGYAFAALGAIAAPSIASAETVVIIKHRHDRYQEVIAKMAPRGTVSFCAPRNDGQ